MAGLTSIKVYRGGISLYFTNKGNSWRMALGISIKNLDVKKQNEISRQLKRNQDLEEYFPNEWGQVKIEKKKIDGIIKNFFQKHSFYPSVDELKNLVKSSFHLEYENSRTQFNISSNFLEVFTEFHKHKLEGVQSGQYSPFTNKDVLTFKNTIIDFQKYYKRNLIILDINEALIKSLFKFFRAERKSSDGFLTQGGLMAKSITKRFDTLKNFVLWLRQYRIYIHEDVKRWISDINLKQIISEVEKYALDNDQLQLIRNVELDEGSPKCKARDMFMLVCYTGMRFSDLISLEKRHIISVGDMKVLRRRAQKTKKKIYEVELCKYAYSLVEKYDFNFNLMSNAKANQYLKEVLAGIDDFCIESTQYFDKSGYPLKIWEIITFHQGRRTFITNLFRVGLNPFEVMKRTDHVKITTLEDYISPSKEKYIDPEKLFGFF